jgi:hypothetical protein
LPGTILVDAANGEPIVLFYEKGAFEQDLAAIAALIALAHP